MGVQREEDRLEMNKESAFFFALVVLFFADAIRHIIRERRFL